MKCYQNDNRQDNPDDVDILIRELEAMSIHPADDDRNRRFADTHAAQTAVLLEELKQWRESAARRQESGGRVIVEGFDEKDMNRAFSVALAKTAGFFSEQHDIAITVLGLYSLPHGGHRVVLEIDITPLCRHLNEHMAAPDIESKRGHERAFAAFRKHEDTHLKELVYDHFLETMGTVPQIPDYFLINFKDADLLNHMIEKQFFKAGHDLPPRHPVPDFPSPAPSPRQALVRIVKKTGG